MKIFLLTALLMTFAPASIHASGWGAETRIFHAYQHMSAQTMRVYESRGPGIDVPTRASFENTAGVGLDATYSWDTGVDLGLGYSFARFHPEPSAQTEQQVSTVFTRWKALTTEFLEVYGLAGASQYQLKTRAEFGPINTSSRSSPLYNYDLGLGGFLEMDRIGFGPLKLGLEYKYSKTFLAGQARGRLEGILLTPASDASDRISTKIEKVSVTNQELSLILALTI